MTVDVGLIDSPAVDRQPVPGVAARDGVPTDRHHPLDHQLPAPELVAEHHDVSAAHRATPRRAGKDGVTDLQRRGHRGRRDAIGPVVNGDQPEAAAHQDHAQGDRHPLDDRTCPPPGSGHRPINSLHSDTAHQNRPTLTDLGNLLAGRVQRQECRRAVARPSTLLVGTTARARPTASRNRIRVLLAPRKELVGACRRPAVRQPCAASSSGPAAAWQRHRRRRPPAGRKARPPPGPSGRRCPAPGASPSG